MVEKGEFVTVEETIGVTVVLALLRCDEDRLCRSKPSLGRKVSKRAKRSARCFRAGKGEDAGSAPLRVGPSFGRACGVEIRLVFCVYCFILEQNVPMLSFVMSVSFVIFFIFVKFCEDNGLERRSDCGRMLSACMQACVNRAEESSLGRLGPQSSRILGAWTGTDA